MNLTVNELKISVNDKNTLFEIRDRYKSDADILIVDGHVVKENIELYEGAKISLIKRGEVPTRSELESLMMARHTPAVHEKVKKASVAIAGLGGLGSNIALALARIGVGKLLLVDYDVVEPSNLNRQEYFVKHIGMKKTNATKQIIKEINPFIQIETINEYVTKENVLSLFEDYKIVVEAFDDPKNKAMLVNEILFKTKDTYLVCGSGMAGYFESNLIKTTKKLNRLYICGDETNEAKIGSGLMAPRVRIAAGHQANAVLRIIMEEYEV